ncbi:MAG TPA: ATP-binding protein [Acidobacteriota bacterium]|nr:ATP-binding protein [Acidobacteriota bacterium]HNU02024.1 ATP-binding protein [Acidobacteriota bacterium]HQP74929.1 ATP-binding protein [Acidobacteriota bacterium]
MPVETADAGAFFERARLEAERYGEDGWVFLRELVQNARDARATRIEFETVAAGGDEQLTCRDNGAGMSPDDVDRFLLRLYASSKEDDRDSIGFFGVGFWSVLLFEPREIRVVTRNGGTVSAFTVDCVGRRIRPLPPPADPAPGTTITLVRPAPDGAAPDALAAAVREQLDRHAGYVRPLPGIRALELFCDGARLNRGFELPHRLGRRVRTRRFDGVLGFGPAPSVRIYKGGILVRETAGLDEVIPSRPVRLPRSGWGLFPVVAINIDGLRLLMDRHTICEDPLLHEAVRYCERELLRIHRRLLSRLFPLDWRNAMTSLWARGRTHVAGAAAGLALAVIAIAALVWAAPRLAPGLAGPGGGDLPGRSPTREAPPAVIRTVDTLFTNWGDTRTDRPADAGHRWDFEYRGPDGLLFQAGALERYDPRRGPAPGPLRLAGPYPAFADDASAGPPVAVRLGVSGGVPRFALPLPPGFVLIYGTLRLDGAPVAPAGRDAFGAPVIAAARRGHLEYRARPGAVPSAAPDEPARPVIDWPPDAAETLRQAEGLDPGDRVERLAAWTAGRLRYSRDPATAADLTGGTGEWLERVLRAGAGDCDVVNGALVLMLQGAGVPAHLRVGLVGEGGAARPELHAWAAYWRDGWRTLDLTRPDPSALGAPPPGGTAAVTARPPAAAAEAATAPPLPFRFYLLIGAAALAATGLLGAIWRRLVRPRLDEPQFVRDIFEHYFAYGSGRDPLRLRYRPVLPTLGGRRLSLHQAQRLADRGRLLGARPGCPLLAGLSRRRDTLDRAAPVVELLEPYLPPVTWLEDVAGILAAPPLPPALREAEALIRRRDPLFRLHLLPGSADFREVCLPFRAAAAGRRHVVVGDQHPVGAAMLRDGAAGSGDGARRAAAQVLARTTFYLGEAAPEAVAGPPDR